MDKVHGNSQVASESPDFDICIHGMLDPIIDIILPLTQSSLP